MAKTFNVVKGVKIIAPETALYSHVKTNHNFEKNPSIKYEMMIPGDIIEGKEGKVIFAGCDEKGSIRYLPNGCNVVSVDEHGKEYTMKDENGHKTTESYFDNAVFITEKPKKSAIRKFGEALLVGGITGVLVAGGVVKAIDMYDNDYIKGVPQTYATQSTSVENAHGTGSIDGATIHLDPTHSVIGGNVSSEHNIDLKDLELDLGNVSLQGRASQVSVTPYYYPNGTSAGEVRTFTNETNGVNATGKVSISGQIVDRERGIFSGVIDGEAVTGRLSAVGFEYNTTGTSVQTGTTITDTPVLKASQLGIDLGMVGGALVGGVYVGKKGAEYMSDSGKADNEASKEMMKFLKTLETTTEVPDGVLSRKDAIDLLSLQFANDRIYANLSGLVEHPELYNRLVDDLAQFYTLADDYSKVYSAREKNKDLSPKTIRMATDVRTEADAYLHAFSEINPMLGAIDSSFHDTVGKRKALIKEILEKAYPDE